MKTSQDSFFWSELADLTHETQVAIFNWCGCEDGEKLIQIVQKNLDKCQWYGVKYRYKENERKSHGR